MCHSELVIQSGPIREGKNKLNTKTSLKVRVTLKMEL